MWFGFLIILTIFYVFPILYYFVKYCTPLILLIPCMILVGIGYISLPFLKFWKLTSIMNIIMKLDNYINKKIETFFG